MSKGELSDDLETLKSEYRYKINLMSEKFRNNQYQWKRREKMIEILASYMASLDKLEFMETICFENEWKYQSKYSEYKRRIRERY